MFGFGIGEMLVILVIVLIIFGAGRLPELGEGLGRGIRNFRKATSEPDSIDVTPPRPDGDEKPAADPAGPQSPGGPGDGSGGRSTPGS